jgi:cytoskeletal protein RodZ
MSRIDMSRPGDRGDFEFPIGDELRGERATLGRSLLDVQRELRIRAAYVAAIENTDPRVCPDPSFVPGYVRAYARYLGLDPDAVYTRFCAESGFAGPGAAAPGAKAARAVRPATAPGPDFRMAFPLAEPPRRGLAFLQAPAIGSLLVLAGLAGGLGYAGWTVLENIQRVQFAPVEEAPAALAAAAAPAQVEAPEPVTIEPELTELARPVAATALAELYRRQELEVPILAPRDGPIAAIDPDRAGLLAAAPSSAAARPAVPQSGAEPATADSGVPAAAVAAGPAPLDDAGAAEALLAAEAAAPGLVVVAERAAWIRVYLEDKTVLFEQILETGQTYSPPPDVARPLIWAGNSGSVYVRLGDSLRGPLGSGTRAARDIVLEPAAIAERFGEVAVVPEAIARALAPEIEAAAVLR